jgi:hypothetical protein
MTTTISEAAAWFGIDPAIWAAIIGALATWAAALMSGLVVLSQIGRQARTAIDQNRDNERLRLHLRVYEQIISACAVATEANVAVSGYVRLFASNVEVIKSLKESGRPYVPPPARVSEFSRLFQAAKTRGSNSYRCKSVGE